jgi:hypothetical protein
MGLSCLYIRCVKVRINLYKILNISLSRERSVIFQVFQGLLGIRAHNLLNYRAYYVWMERKGMTTCPYVRAFPIYKTLSTDVFTKPLF